MIRAQSKVSMVLSSSPARVEKLAAPPLSKLLSRRNSSSSSSSAARSSPMFMAKSVSARGVDFQEEREPSSPKVTCIGQVRIAKRKQQKRDVFCNIFSGGLGKKIKFRKFKHFLKHQGCFRRMEAEGRRQLQRRLLKEEDGSLMGPEGAGHAGSEEEGERAGGFASAVPPKNALLLMRCRSAPHRATAFPDRLDSAAGVLNEGIMKQADSIPAEMDGRDGESTGAASATVVAPAVVGPSPLPVRPLILTRCRSEPAWTAAKLTALEAHNCFWNAAITTRLAAPGESRAAGTVDGAGEGGSVAGMFAMKSSSCFLSSRSS